MSIARNQVPNRAMMEDPNGGEKPLAATLLQEFQNLKDKFKNEDDENDKGAKLSIFPLQVVLLLILYPCCIIPPVDFSLFRVTLSIS